MWKKGNGFCVWCRSSWFHNYENLYAEAIADTDNSYQRLKITKEYLKDLKKKTERKLRLDNT